MFNRSAMYQIEEGEEVRCKLCPQYCLIKKGNYGLCKTRKNIENHLYAVNYEQVTAIALDPIEKKPVYHFKPGYNILSIGTFGCNMTCSFCQNYRISQTQAKSDTVTIEYIKHLIEKTKVNDRNIGIAFTYNEPFMWYEYILDTAKVIKNIDDDHNIVIVSNGYINEKPLKELLPYVDAMNIDLKAFTNNYYRKICGAKLDPVLNTIKIAAKSCHIEVTTLIVTGENDNLDEITELAEFIAEIDPNIPLHLTRYYPNYQMNQEPTDVKILVEAKKRANHYLNYVYIGNVAGIDLNTYCHQCKELIINRNSKSIKTSIVAGKCPRCNEKINIIT